MGQHPVLATHIPSGGENDARRVGQHLLQRQAVGLPQPARGGEIGKASAAQEVRDQRRLSRHEAARLPDERRDRCAIAARACQCRVNPCDQRIASRLVARQQGEFAHLRPARGNVAGDAEGPHFDPQPREGGTGGGRQEAARHHHVRVERQHFLHRSAGGGEAMRDIEVHRAGGRVVTIVTYGEQLPRRSHFRQHGVGAGVEADDGGLLAPRPPGGGGRSASRRQNTEQGGEQPHIAILAPI